MNPSSLRSVYAAAVTPLKPDLTPDLESVPLLLDFLARRGCHGALLFGTTGEGPSFDHKTRLAVWQAALAVRQKHPDFRLLAGTGTPSLEETLTFTRATFDLGYDGVVVLPPYYFRNASDDGLFTWFSQVITRAMPGDGALLGYHIPAVSGVALSLELLARLKEAYPRQFVGLKDSSMSLEHAQTLGTRFGSDLLIFNGTDPLFSQALQYGASGCITALGNLFSPDLRRVWDAHLLGNGDPIAQANLDQARTVSAKYPPAPPLIKAVLHHVFGFPLWPVCPPLVPLLDSLVQQAIAALPNSLTP
jgi:4-hydroxy-tetrahydrodipicolinate synthase